MSALWTVTVDSKSAAIISPTQGQNFDVCLHYTKKIHRLSSSVGYRKFEGTLKNTIRVVIRNGASEAFNTKSLYH